MRARNTFTPRVQMPVEDPKESKMADTKGVHQPPPPPLLDVARKYTNICREIREVRLWWTTASVHLTSGLLDD